MDALEFIVKYFKECLAAYNKITANLDDKTVKTSTNSIIVFNNDKIEVGINSSGLYHVLDGKNKKLDVNDFLKYYSEDIVVEITNNINSIHSMIENLIAIPFAVDSYPDLFKAILDKSKGNKNGHIIFNKPEEMTVSMGVTSDIRQDGEQFGLGKFSSISFSFLLNMQVSINNVNDYTSFAYELGTNVVSNLFEKFKKDNLIEQDNKEI